MRQQSFSATTPQMRAKTKDVTRRLGWKNLRAGEVLMAIEKGMGLKKGEKVVQIGPIEVLSVRTERVDAILKEGQAGADREGFPQMTPAEFVTFFCDLNGCIPSTLIQRIEFKHLY